MTSAKTRSFLVLLLLSTSILFLAGCGSAGGGSTTTPAPGWTWQPPTSASTATPMPTSTPIASLPASSDVTLVKVSTANNNVEGVLYLGDTSSGDIWEVKTQPGSRLSPSQWISPTRLIVMGFYRDYYLLDLSAKTLHRLPGSWGGPDVMFSHSGEFMAKIDADGELVIWSVTEDRELARINTGPIGYVYWSPDDSHIFWPGAPAGIATVGPAPVVVAVDMGQGYPAATWTSDGKSIVYSNGDGIHSVDAASAEKTALYSWPAGTDVRSQAPRLSPDGRYALESVTNAGGGFSTVVVPLGGGTRGFQVTAVDVDSGVWSPSADVVAIIAGWCKPESRLLLLNPDGTVRSTVEGAVQIPRFSPDGSTIAYLGPDSQGGRDGGLVVRSVEGEGVVAFLPGFGRDDAWSPDGRWLAYAPGLAAYQCADTAGNTQILPFP